MTTLDTYPLLPGSRTIELIRPDFPRGRLRAALFDFDGTVSLIRAGWPDVMVPLLTDELAKAPRAEDRATLEVVVREWVDRLTGKQTIYQMIALAEAITARGGVPEDPLVYKRRYLEALDAHIAWRLEGLRDGRIAPDDLRVPGVYDLIVNLRARGITCYLASGTDLPYVQAAAEALGVAELFDGGIGGALDDYRSFSKAIVIQRILEDHGLHGPELVAFGDGYVEIENTVAVGGIAVGAATDELVRGGLDAWKRNRLIGVGANLLAPDFREQERLVAWLCGAG